MAPEHPEDVRRYLVEWYRPAQGEHVLEQTAQRIARSAREMSTDGAGVDLLLTLYVPGDEVAFCLFAADSAESVARVCRRAQLPYDRIAEALAAPAHLGPFVVSDGHVSGGDTQSPTDLG
jgi:hypothetical protein